MARQVYTGFHAVEERIRRFAEDGGRDGETLSLYYDRPGPRVKKILALAREAGLSPSAAAAAELDGLVGRLPPQSRDHRGLVLVAEGGAAQEGSAVELSRWLGTCPGRATVLMLDGVTDPHNVGAIIRSCDQFGAALLILPERRSAADVLEGEVVARASAGASAYVPVAVVTNLSRAAEQLKEAGFWLYAADTGGQELGSTAFADRTCLVMGSEGSGISRLLSRQCDSTVSIPTCGRIDSLNVSVAAGILLYERNRRLLEGEP